MSTTRYVVALVLSVGAILLISSFGGGFPVHDDFAKEDKGQELEDKEEDSLAQVLPIACTMANSGVLDKFRSTSERSVRFTLLL